MRKIYNLLIKNEFLKNSTFLISGTGVAAIIQLLASPVLTRLYSSEDFGVFGLFFSFVGVFSLIVTARCEQIIILPKDEISAAILALVSIVFSIVFSLITLFGIAVVFSIIRYDIWLFYVPLVCLFLGFSQIGYVWLIRHKRFHTLGSIRALQWLIIMSLNVLFAFIFRKYWGLIAGYVVGQIVVSIFVLTNVFKEIRRYLIAISMAKILGVINRYKKFLLYLNLADIVEYLTLYAPTFFLAAFFDNSVVGFYVLAQTATIVPVNVVSTAIGEVFKQKINLKYINKEDCNNFFIKVFILLTVLAGSISMVFFIAAPYIFGLVFGSTWKISGEYARILAFLLFFRFIAVPLGNMFLITEKSKLKFFISFCFIIGIALSFLCGYYIFHNVKISLMLFVIAGSIKYMFDLIMSYRFSLYKYSSIEF